MDDIDLPMTKGTMEDITQENEASSQPDGSTETPTDSMSSQGAKRIYEKEANILIDYSRLDDDLKEVITVDFQNLEDPDQTASVCPGFCGRQKLH